MQIVIIPEGGTYSAYDKETKIASQGSTISKAIANLKEAVELHKECLKKK